MESPRRILQGTIDQLLLEVRRESQNNLEGPSLPENLLSALHSVFQQSLLHALDLVDKNHVIVFLCVLLEESYSKFKQVLGTESTLVWCPVTTAIAPHLCTVWF